MIKEKAIEVLRSKEFVSIGTADKSGYPNAVPKFLLKIEKNHVYLIDYTIAKTVENLRENPFASLSVMDIDNLVGYKLDGPVELISKGKEYKKILGELKKRLIKLSVDRIIKASRSGKKNTHYELELPEKFIVIKMNIKGAAKISSRGDLLKESS